MQVLVGQGANVNSSNKVNGWTALHWAAYRGHRYIIIRELPCSTRTVIFYLESNGEHEFEYIRVICTFLRLVSLIFSHINLNMLPQLI